MPWKSSSIMDERIRFVILANQSKIIFSSLCADFGISRQTGYRWLRRYQKSGSITSLEDRSSRPHTSPARISSKLEKKIITLRNSYGWGARKLEQLLLKQGLSVPPSTIHNVLKRNGLIVARPSHRPALKRFQRSCPNQLWQMDFKGDYAVAEGRCYPLTILDDHSRYSLGIFALTRQTVEQVRSSLVRVFRKYGLPDAMLMDHGSPWYGNANVHGLTRLSVWLMKQDIQLIYSAVAHPQTQGKIERFHRTLNENARFHGTPKSLKRWQDHLKTFRHEYNHIRPHEALNMATPASVYEPSTRRYHRRS